MELLKEPKRGLYLTKYNDEKIYNIDLHRNYADDGEGTSNYVQVDSNGDSLWYGSSSSSSSNSNSNNNWWEWWESISDNLGDWFSGIGSIIGNIKGNTPTNNYYMPPSKELESKEKSNTIIIIAIALVFLIIIVFLFLKNK